jgi:lipid A ethanolaminephosphotransferase
VILLIVSSLAAFFMDSYSVVINDEMLNNVAQTNFSEATDLVNAKLLAYLAFLGVLPSIGVARLPLIWRETRREVVARVKLLGALALLVAGTVLSFGSFYASLAREHRELRTYANPSYYLYSTVKVMNASLGSALPTALAMIGIDAQIPASDVDRELIIMVVGETARADRFSLNGYRRDTNPQLAQAKVVSFTNVWACGTSTAVSVPCMFYLGGQEDFSLRAAGSRENLLDVLQRSGVNVLWLDNNSDSKGVASRVPYQSYKTAATNSVCGGDECRDEGMIAPLQNYIDTHPRGDIFIVLHQMGNHGPAYFKRYPPEFERFKPVCKSSDLNQCSQDEIDNAYDNAISYTDHFLSRVIELLKRNDEKFETAMLYVSDHGESLGENGVYLHGMPKAIAPDSQLHVPMVMWFGQHFDGVDLAQVQKSTAVRYTHDNVFHTVLGMMEIETAIYRPDLDILRRH